MNDPMATYLAYFAAGRFAIDRGRAHGLRYFNAVSRRLPRQAEEQALRVLHRSAAVTAWLQHQVGRYPFATTGGLVTSLQVGFALENQSRPTYPSWPNAGVVVHELAHQWFGDSVSVERWRDIWLNEGFASYMELRWEESRGGRSTSRVLHQRYHQNRDKDSFWALDVADPCKTDPAPCPWWNLFDTAVYNRGAMARAALRNRIGDDDFTRVLRRWVRHRAGGNGKVPQFEALAERVSGEDLGDFFDAWLSGDTAPPRTAAYGL
jgi:aminopeptidase N